MALVFPVGPLIGDLYPPNPGTSGVTQYEYDGVKWNAVSPAVSLGVQNQGAYNSYQWPLVDGALNEQLTTDGAGGLTWAVSSTPSLQVLIVDRPFNGVDTAYTLYESGTTTPFSPVPSTNIVVFLGGVPQIPVVAFVVAGSTITFTEPPLAGTTFYAISNVNA